eukprot:60257-Rhodomonas_salina.1
MLVEWAEQLCPKCYVCKGGFSFICFDLGTYSHVRFVWMCIACTWNTNTDILCKGPVPTQHEYDCQPAAPSLVALRNFRLATIALQGMHLPLPSKARVLIRHQDFQAGVSCPASLEPIVVAAKDAGKQTRRENKDSKAAPQGGARTNEGEAGHVELPASPPFTVQVPNKLPTPEKVHVPARVIFEDGTVMEDCWTMSLSSDYSD